MEEARRLMTAIGLEINEEKTHLVSLPEDRFDFLGYTFGRFYAGKTRQPYIGTCPSKKALKRVRKRIHDETSIRWNQDTAEDRVQDVNAILRGWCNYFDQGPVYREYHLLKRYMLKTALWSYEAPYCDRIEVVREDEFGDVNSATEVSVRLL